ncbi:hypothetical protein ACYOEI_17960 [Singulisphaera rosea]
MALVPFGCGDDDDDDEGAPSKTPIPMDQVPAAVLKAAKTAKPELTFYAAYNDTFKGQPSIELKGKSKTGKITEVEVSPDGKVLGTE